MRKGPRSIPADAVAPLPLTRSIVSAEDGSAGFQLLHWPTSSFLNGPDYDQFGQPRTSTSYDQFGQLRAGLAENRIGRDRKSRPLHHAGRRSTRGRKQQLAPHNGRHSSDSAAKRRDSAPGAQPMTSTTRASAFTFQALVVASLSVVGCSSSNEPSTTADTLGGTSGSAGATASGSGGTSSSSGGTSGSSGGTSSSSGGTPGRSGEPQARVAAPVVPAGHPARVVARRARSVPLAAARPQESTSQRAGRASLRTPSFATRFAVLSTLASRPKRVRRVPM